MNRSSGHQFNPLPLPGRSHAAAGSSGNCINGDPCLSPIGESFYCGHGFTVGGGLVGVGFGVYEAPLESAYLEENAIGRGSWCSNTTDKNYFHYGGDNSGYIGGEEQQTHSGPGEPGRYELWGGSELSAGVWDLAESMENVPLFPFLDFQV